MPQNWNQTSQPIREIGIRRIPRCQSGLLSRVSREQQGIENEAEENPRITVIDAPETSNLWPFIYRFTFTKYRKIKRRFYRLFVKTSN